MVAKRPLGDSASHSRCTSALVMPRAAAISSMEPQALGRHGPVTAFTRTPLPAAAG